MRKIIVDTSPLVIHMVGAFDKKLVSKVSLYNSPYDELKCVDRLISSANDIFMTSYVFGELFYLAKTRLNQDMANIKNVLIEYKEIITGFKEIHVNKDEILNFWNLEFGPTDVSIFLAAKILKCPILTSDGRFIDFCESQGVEVINFAGILFNQ